MISHPAFTLNASDATVVHQEVLRPAVLFSQIDQMSMFVQLGVIYFREQGVSAQITGGVLNTILYFCGQTCNHGWSHWQLSSPLNTGLSLSWCTDRNPDVLARELTFDFSSDMFKILWLSCNWVITSILLLTTHFSAVCIIGHWKTSWFHRFRFNQTEFWNKVKEEGQFVIWKWMWLTCFTDMWILVWLRLLPFYSAVPNDPRGALFHILLQHENRSHSLLLQIMEFNVISLWRCFTDSINQTAETYSIVV